MMERPDPRANDSSVSPPGTSEAPPPLPPPPENDRVRDFDGEADSVRIERVILGRIGS